MWSKPKHSSTTPTTNRRGSKASGSNPLLSEDVSSSSPSLGRSSNNSLYDRLTFRHNPLLQSAKPADFYNESDYNILSNSELNEKIFRLKWLGINPLNNDIRANETVNDKILSKSYLVDHEIDLISIFGAARQGKSFLMNILADEPDLFPVSNQREPCTQGIDISSKFVSLDDFTNDNVLSKNVKQSRKNSAVGFLDAEGQGDRDITYDAKLICPVLLVSKIILFNWKDSLQIDRILNLLGILANSAKKIQLDKKKTAFGHLHIIFRDWQFANTKEADVFKDLFDLEGSNTKTLKEAEIRNKARSMLLESFESITIWLFPTPVNDLNKLMNSKNLNKSEINPGFMNKVKELKSCIGGQLMLRNANDSDNNQILTGGRLMKLMPAFTELLNSDDVIMPEPLFKTIMKEEANELITFYQNIYLPKTIETLFTKFRIYNNNEHLSMKEKEINDYFSNRLSNDIEKRIVNDNNKTNIYTDDVITYIIDKIKDFIAKICLPQIKEKILELKKKRGTQLLNEMKKIVDNHFNKMMTNSNENNNKHFPCKRDILENNLLDIKNKALALIPTDQFSEYDEHVIEFNKYFSLNKEKILNINENIDKLSQELKKSVNVINDKLSTELVNTYVSENYNSLAMKNHYSRKASNLVDEEFNRIIAEYNIQMDSCVSYDVKHLINKLKRELIGRLTNKISEIENEHKMSSHMRKLINEYYRRIKNDNAANKFYSKSDNELENEFLKEKKKILEMLPKDKLNASILQEFHSHCDKIFNKIKIINNECISSKLNKIIKEIKNCKDKQFLSLRSTLAADFKECNNETFLFDNFMLKATKVIQNNLNKIIKLNCNGSEMNVIMANTEIKNLNEKLTHDIGDHLLQLFNKHVFQTIISIDLNDAVKRYSSYIITGTATANSTDFTCNNTILNNELRRKRDEIFRQTIITKYNKWMGNTNKTDNNGDLDILKQYFVTITDIITSKLMEKNKVNEIKKSIQKYNRLYSAQLATLRQKLSYDITNNNGNIINLNMEYLNKLCMESSTDICNQMEKADLHSINEMMISNKDFKHDTVNLFIQKKLFDELKDSFEYLKYIENLQNESKEIKKLLGTEAQLRKESENRLDEIKNENTCDKIKIEKLQKELNQLQRVVNDLENQNTSTNQFNTISTSTNTNKNNNNNKLVYHSEDDISDIHNNDSNVTVDEINPNILFNETSKTPSRKSKRKTIDEDATPLLIYPRGKNAKTNSQKKRKKSDGSELAKARQEEIEKLEKRANDRAISLSAKKSKNKN